MSKEKKDELKELMLEVDTVFDQQRLKLLTGGTERQIYQQRALNTMRDTVKNMIRKLYEKKAN